MATNAAFLGPDAVERGRTTLVENDYRWITPVAWAILLFVGGVHAIGFRYAMNPDGISYLDLARATAHSDWAQTINGYWSPLYPWLVGLAFRLLRPSANGEFAVAHMVNFAIYLLAAVAFEFFLREALRARDRARHEDDVALILPEWTWRLLGYSAFAWSTLVLTGLANITPDLLLVAVVYAASGIVLRIANNGGTLRSFAAFGGALAIGYLTKGAMLPLAVVYFAVSCLASPRNCTRGIAVASVTFAVIALPYVLILSNHKGRLTVGDTAKLNYAWFVNDVPMFKRWVGKRPGHGAASHPTRLLVHQPPTYEFAQPVEGTYPLWYDPSYWYDGVKIRFDARQQLHRLLREAGQLPWVLRDLFFPLAALLILRLRRQIRLDRRTVAMLSLPALAATVMYLLVHIEQRFLGGFLGVLVIAAALATRLRSDRAKEAMIVVASVLTMLFGIRVLQASAPAAAQIRLIASGRQTNVERVTASRLQAEGIAAGKRVAIVGDGFRAYWAYVGHYRISGEVALREFWAATPEERAASIQALRRISGDNLVMDAAYGCPANEGWIRVQSTALCRYVGSNP